jgi:PEP-CTERM motif
MKHLIASVAALGILTSAAQAATVNATDDIYAVAGNSTLPQGATVPSTAISVNGGDTLTFSVPAGSAITLNGGGNINDADGVGAGTASSINSGAGSISGITAPNAGFLVGVFVPSGGPTGPAPTSLDFTSSGIGTSFASLSPTFDQVFFIGDGLTGDGTGTIQDFIAPGAGTLYLGISDACGYSGGPSCYNDNSGSFTVAITDTAGVTSAVPEPSTWAMMILGFCGLGFMAYRRKQNGAALSVA